MAGRSISLYLVRHGLAAERGADWPDDAKRPLVRQGIERLRQEARGLVSLDVAFDVLLTSPLVRARQTADVLSAGLPGHPPVRLLESLAPGTPQSRLLGDLASRGDRPHVALVGHEPDLGRLAARLLGARRPLDFKKGAICRIDVDSLPLKDPGHLRWFVTPRMLRRLGG